MSNYKVVAPIPVHGRFPLLELTIKRLYEVNGVHKVICVGDEPEAKEIAERLGAEWVECDNSRLGRKWNEGFKACEKYNPDGVLFVGSSDWVSKNYIQEVMPYLDEFDMVGKLGCHFADVRNNEIRSVRWDGYGKGVRAEEPIGIGRILSSKSLSLMGWKPFDSMLDSSLDWSMYNRVLQTGGEIGIVTNPDLKLLSISTDKWINKHIFNDHWNNKLPSVKENVFLTLREFPELLELL